MQLKYALHHSWGGHWCALPPARAWLCPPPLLDQYRRDWLSTGFLIYGPLYKEGLGTQHSLSSDIESQLPSMEMRVVCYCVKAYLHCAVKLSVATTTCLLTSAAKFIFACSAVRFRHIRDILRKKKVQWRQIALQRVCVYTFVMWLCIFEYIMFVFQVLFAHLSLWEACVFFWAHISLLWSN